MRFFFLFLEIKYNSQRNDNNCGANNEQILSEI